MFATTWETGWVAVIDKPRLVGEVREKLKDRVDEFINDYLAANPKEPEKKGQTLAEMLEQATKVKDE